jgi:hypothetical protein
MVECLVQVTKRKIPELMQRGAEAIKNELERFLPFPF